MNPDTNRPAIVVTILGSGTCVPSLQRSSCALLVETRGAQLLLDAGAGTTRRMLESGKQPADLTHVLLSHFHPDHSAELASILFSAKYPTPDARSGPLTIIGGTGLLDFFGGLKQAYGTWIELPDELVRFEEMDTETPDLRRYADFELKSIPVRHNPESIAYEINAAGCRVVYSGDTGFTENLIHLAADADLLICESAMPENEGVDGHLTPSQAGEIAHRAGVRHLVLTHFYPECEASDIVGSCRKRYAGKLSLAADLDRFILPARTDAPAHAGGGNDHAADQLKEKA